MVCISDIESPLNNIVSSFCFRGSVKSKDNLPLDASIGDIYISNNDNATWVCTTTTSKTSKWDVISSPSDYSLTNKPVKEKRITYPTNCKNCGAILHNHICEYCGSDNSINA